MNDYLKNFIEQNHFKNDKKFFYGLYKNRLISIISSSTFEKVVVTFNIPLTRENGAKFSNKISEIKANNRILQQGLTTNVSVELIFYNSSDFSDAFIRVLDQVIEVVDEFQTVGCDVCPLCGRQMPSNSPFIRIKDTAVQAHEECIQQLVGASDQMKNKIGKSEKKALLINTLVSIVVMLFMISIAALGSMFGYYSYVLGFSGWICFSLSGLSIRSLKKPFAFGSLIMLTIVSILCILLSNYVGLGLMLYKQYNFSLAESFGKQLIILIENPEFTEQILIVVGLAFLLLGTTLFFNYRQFLSHRNNVKRI